MYKQNTHTNCLYNFPQIIWMKCNVWSNMLLSHEYWLQKSLPSSLSICQLLYRKNVSIVLISHIRLGTSYIYIYIYIYIYNLIKSDKNRYRYIWTYNRNFKLGSKLNQIIGAIFLHLIQCHLIIMRRIWECLLFLHKVIILFTLIVVNSMCCLIICWVLCNSGAVMAVIVWYLDW